MNSDTFKSKYEDKVQKPGGFKKFILYFLMVLDVFMILFSLLGLFMKETEMIVMFGVMAVILLVIIIMITRAYDTSYQERAEDFILKVRKQEYRVFYEDIIDWKPGFNEIKVLDKTRADETYIRVNNKFFKPEILLRNIVKMAFSGEFTTSQPVFPGDVNREIESANYVNNIGFGYLIEDYLEKIQSE